VSLKQLYNLIPFASAAMKERERERESSEPSSCINVSPTNPSIPHFLTLKEDEKNKYISV
jgi:hypothetical protein